MMSGSRRIPLSHGSHIVGSQILATGRVEHESALERDFVMMTSFRDAGATLVAQPVTIHFDGENRVRRYTPDFEVRWTDGRIELVEVKYRTDLTVNWRRLRPAFAACRSWAHARGMTFRIATERGIRGMKLENAKRLLPLRRAPIDAELARTALTLAANDGQTFRQLVASLPVSAAEATALVWRLIAHDALIADTSKAIDGNTRLLPS